MSGVKKFPGVRLLNGIYRGEVDALQQARSEKRHQKKLAEERIRA
jgi:hypothetical protein